MKKNERMERLRASMKDTRAISEIKIGNRARKDMGDIAGLAASITDVGLLHPVVISKTDELIAGERRIRAYELLGKTEIQVTVIDLAEIVRGEHAENEQRKDFTLTEAVAIKRAVEPMLAAEAKARKTAGTNQHSEPSAKLADGSKGDTRDNVAKATGKKRTTLAKAEEVIEAGEAEPEKFAALVEEMNHTGKVDGAYKQLKTLKASPADIAKADRAEVRATATKLAAATPTPGSNTTAGAGLINLIEHWGRINVSDTIARMSNEDRAMLMTDLVQANTWLNKTAVEIAVAGGAKVGKLASTGLRFEALDFLKAATARIEAELGQTAAPAIVVELEADLTNADDPLVLPEFLKRTAS
jgi:ParB-like chromosome segregation protein Spo0J